jgi:hypothetical protein
MIITNILLLMIFFVLISILGHLIKKDTEE